MTYLPAAAGGVSRPFPLLSYLYRSRTLEWIMTGPDVFSRSPGTYVLRVDVERPSRIRVGALGSRPFQPGAYFYFGSARGPGGLRARLTHHSRQSSSPHWHIDYLRLHARVTGVWTATGRTRLECDWLRRLIDLRGLEPAAPGFGASDCRCRTHLLRAARVEPLLIARIGERLHPAIAQSLCWA